MASNANAINATLYNKLNFDFLRDIALVASVARVPLVMVVNPLFPAKTVPDFITYAKANPGRSTWLRPVTEPLHISLASCSK